MGRPIRLFPVRQGGLQPPAAPTLAVRDRLLLQQGLPTGDIRSDMCAVKASLTNSNQATSVTRANPGELLLPPFEFHRVTMLHPDARNYLLHLLLCNSS